MSENPDLHQEPGKGPNLVLIYAVFAVLLIGALLIAAMIVKPFYLRH